MNIEPLWSVRAKRSTAKCLLRIESAWTEVFITDDEDVVAAREFFRDVEEARIHAERLHERLIEKGWRDAS